MRLCLYNNQTWQTVSEMLKGHQLDELQAICSLFNISEVETRLMSLRHFGTKNRHPSLKFVDPLPTVDGPPHSGPTKIKICVLPYSVEPRANVTMGDKLMFIILGNTAVQTSVNSFKTGTVQFLNQLGSDSNHLALIKNEFSQVFGVPIESLDAMIFHNESALVNNCRQVTVSLKPAN